MTNLVPSVRLTSTTLRLRPTGRVRIVLRGTQTAAATVSITQLGGRYLGGTEGKSYTCTAPTDDVIALPLNAYGLKLARRHSRLNVAVTFRLVNGSGVRNTIMRTGIIRPE